MDFTTLDLGPAATSRSETAATIVPLLDGSPIPLKGGSDLEMTILLPNTPEGQRELRKWRLRHKQEATATGDPTEAELDALVDQEIEGETDLAARVVKEWNLVDNEGQRVECSIENRRAFFAHFHAIRASTLLQMSARVEALGK